MSWSPHRCCGIREMSMDTTCNVWEHQVPEKRYDPVVISTHSNLRFTLHGFFFVGGANKKLLAALRARRSEQERSVKRDLTKPKGT
jgi:hypothetical protein